MKAFYRHVYLSPHFDDASLSCGGAIHKYVKAEEAVLVVTVCAAPPGPADPLSPFARKLHASWGSPTDVVAARRAEDQAAMAELGVEYLHLDFTDCIYRGRPHDGKWFYNNDAELFGQIHPDDAALADDIAAAVARTVPTSDQTILYAPLTVGNHVDHQLVHTAAWRLWNEINALVFFEDYPYAEPGYAPHGLPSTPGLADTLASLGSANLQPRLLTLAEDDLQAKISSIAAYESQVPFLFGGQSELSQRLNRYALLVGDGIPAERIWVPG